VIDVVDKYCNPQSNICGGTTTDWMNRCVNIRSNFARRARWFGRGVLRVAERRAESFPATAQQHIPGGARAASSWPASGIVSPSFPSSPDFFAQEMPVQKTDLTTVIVRRRIGRFFTS